MVVEDSRHEIASILELRENHDDEAPCTDVVHMMLKVDRFLRGSSQSNHRSLEARQEAMLGSARIEAMQATFPVKDVDVLSIDTGPKQFFDRRARIRGIGDGADDTICWIRNKVAWMMRHKVRASPSAAGSADAPVGAPERFDQRGAIEMRGRDLVVITIIASISGTQSARAQANTCTRRERSGRRNVVGRVVRPDPQIVKHRSDGDLFEHARCRCPIASSRNRETQVHHPIHMVAIGDEVASQNRGMILQNRADGRDAPS